MTLGKQVNSIGLRPKCQAPSKIMRHATFLNWIIFIGLFMGKYRYHACFHVSCFVVGSCLIGNRSFLSSFLNNENSVKRHRKRKKNY